MSDETAFRDCDPPLSTPVLKVVQDMGFSHMTPVQASSIPLFLSNKDVCAEACTGSGKTLAFVIPIVEILLRREEPLPKHHVGALVVSPTRELAMQIADVLTPYAEAAGLTSQLLVGGTKVEQDMETLFRTSPHILVATPGRLRDVLERPGAPSVREVEVLVLDEADVLLDMGFEEAITAVLRRLPKQRRTGMFSATQTQAVKQLARAGMRNPAVVRVRVRGGSQPAPEGGEAAEGAGPTSRPASGVQQTPHSLKNYYVLCKPEEKIAAMAKFVAERCSADGGPDASQAASEGGAASGSAPSTTGEEEGEGEDGAQPLTKAQRKRRREKRAKAKREAARAARVEQLDSITSRGKFMVFVGTCAGVEFVARLAELRREAWRWPPVVALHGRMAAGKRTAHFKRFRALPSAVLVCTDVAARGLDVPDVDWILQLDAPQDPDFFVHRVGRAARAGRRGASLLMLSPGEETFVHFLELKQVPLQPMAAPEGALGAGAAEEMSAAQALLTQDRDLVDRATRAFVSAVRAYKESRLPLVFRFAHLDLGSLARAHALLRLPRMPELKGRSIDFQPVRTVDVDAIPYADSKRERKRRDRARAQKAEEEREEKEKAAEAEAEAEQADKAGTAQEAPAQKRDGGVGKDAPAAKRRRKGKMQLMKEEWDELAREERLHKKLKNGKITPAQFRREVAGVEEEEEEEEGDGSKAEPVDPDLAALDNPSLLGGDSSDDEAGGGNGSRGRGGQRGGRGRGRGRGRGTGRRKAAWQSRG